MGDRKRAGLDNEAEHLARMEIGAGGAPVAGGDVGVVVAGELVVDAHDLDLFVGRDGLQAGQDLAWLSKHHGAPARGRVEEGQLR